MIEFMGGTKAFQERDAYVELQNVQPGTYYVMVELELAQAEGEMSMATMGSGVTPVAAAAKTFCVNCYSDHPVRFKGDISHLHTIDHILQQAFISKSHKYPETLKLTDMAETNTPEIMRYECADAPEGYNFVYVDNQTRTHCYIEEMSYDLFEGVQLMHT